MHTTLTLATLHTGHTPYAKQPWYMAHQAFLGRAQDTVPSHAQFMYETVVNCDFSGADLTLIRLWE